MKSWGAVFIIAMGFALGFILAGISGINAGLKAAQTQTRIELTKIEDFWTRTDLSETDLRKYVNNKSCVLSEKYFLACVNSVISALSLTKERLTLNGEIIAVTSDANTVDNFNEKENLLPFADVYEKKHHTQFSFDELWNEILSKADEKLPLKYLLAQGLNGFLSVNKDPHTYIMPMEYFTQVASSAERSPYFVGISMEKAKGFIKIKKVVAESDAEVGGLKAGDVIISVNGYKTKAMSLSDVGYMLKEPKNRSFTFNISRNGQSMIKKISRSYRVLSHVNHEIISGKRNIGLIRLSKFAKNICVEVRNAIYDMADKNISGLVIDLRDNPGGHLSEAACLAGLFIGENKKIYSVQYFDLSKSDEVVLTNTERIYSGPLVVMTNTYSASAAELLAGALQEYSRALIVGSKTFGKGTFQEIESWGDSKQVGYFKTKGFYLLPSGSSTQFYGINPDIEVSDGNLRLANEEKSFFNPIRPFIKQFKYQKAELPLQKCGTYKFLQGVDDLILSKALDSLSCGALMSHIALQFNSAEQLTQ